LSAQELRSLKNRLQSRWIGYPTNF